jgi:hypothetical protein
MAAKALGSGAHVRSNGRYSARSDASREAAISSDSHPSYGIASRNTTEAFFRCSAFYSSISAVHALRTCLATHR